MSLSSFVSLIACFLKSHSRVFYFYVQFIFVKIFLLKQTWCLFFSGCPTMRSSGTRTTSSLSSTSSSWCTWSGMFVCGFISSFVWVFLHCHIYFTTISMATSWSQDKSFLDMWNIGDSHCWLETSVCSFSYSIFSIFSIPVLNWHIKKMTLLSSFQ